MATDTKIILKRSSIETAVPNLNYLEFGELAFNYKDEKLYYRAYEGTAEVIKPYDFQRIVPVLKGGTGAANAEGARSNLGAAPLHDPSFTGIASLAVGATQPTTSLSTGAAEGRRLATVAYVRAEIADDAPTKTGVGASGDNWNIGILKNAATASKWASPIAIASNNTATGSDITFSITALDGSAAVTPTLSINTNRRAEIQTALLLVPGTNVQAYDDDLKAIADLTGTSGLLRKTAANVWSLDTTTYTPQTRTITIATGNGITGGSSTASDLSANRSWTLGLTTTGVLPVGTTSGTFNDDSKKLTPFTVDDRGRITSVGADLLIQPDFSSIADTPTDLAGYGITDALDISADAQTKAGSLTASSFIRSGGTSSQFLKADGSSDSTSYTPQTRTIAIANGTGITGGSSTASDLSANRSWTLGLTGQALALHNLTTDGFFVRTGTNTVNARSIAAATGNTGTAFSITNGNGVSGNPTIALATGNLLSLHTNTTNGFLARTADNTITSRSIAVSGTGLSIANADGVLGNPTITSNATNSNTPSTLVARDISGNFSAGAITGSSFIVSGTVNTTLSGSATGTAKTLTLPDKTGTVAVLTDIPDHTGGANTTITAANGRVLSAITVNALGHTTSVSSKDLAAVDIPVLDASKITSGTFDALRISDASVTGKVLTGFVAGTSVSTVAATDTILQAFQKLVPNIAAKANIASPTFTGTVTLPTGSTAAAPLRFISSTNLLTLPVSGAIEFDGTNLYITNSTPLRKTFAYIDSNVSSATTATTAGKFTVAQKISNATSGSDILFDYTFDGSAAITPTLTLNSARASAMRTTLGLAIGVAGGVQAYDADLAAIAALADDQSPTGVDTGFLRKTGENTWTIDQNVTPPAADELYTLTGPDVFGTSAQISRDISATLATINTLTAGTYNNSTTAITPFQVDNKGRVIATGTAVTISPLWSSIVPSSRPTDLAGYGITDALNTSSTAQTKTGSLTASSFIRTGGLVTEFLKANGTVDSTSYVPQTRTLTISGATNSGISVTPSTATNLSANASWSISLATGNLTQLRDLTNTGIIVHDGTVGGGMVTRSIVSGNTDEITITNGNGVSANPSIALTTSNLTSLRALTTTGLLARTAANTVTSRSIAVSGTGLSIANADGVSGNPTLTLSSNSSNVNSTLVLRDASGNFSAGAITGTNFRASQGVPNSTDASTVGYAFGTDGDTGLFSPIVGSGGGANGVVSLYTNNTERLRADSTGVTLSGTVSTGNAINVGSADANNTIINVGTGATGNKFALTDYVGDTTYTDYGLRVGRKNDGANGTSTIEHRGTGALSLNAIDAGFISLATSNLERMRVLSNGNVGIGKTNPSTILDVNGTITATSYSGSATLSGTPTAPTATAGTNTTQIATTAYVRGEISALIDNAPAALDTLNELAAALDDNASYASTITTALAGKEPTITAGTTGQYWRGDKSWQTLNSTAVGLGNVNNTSDANKPVSTAQQTALDLKANLASPTFTGTVSGITATMVGLGNVTNESKATMFTSPTFTGSTTKIGSSTTRSYYLPGFDTNYTSGIQGVGNSYASPAWLSLAQWSTSTTNSGGAFISLNKSNGVEGTQTIVSNNQRVGGIGFAGSDGAKFLGVADVYGEVDATPTLNSMPGRLVFATTADGFTAPSERMRITRQGRVGIWTTNPSSALDVNGTITATAFSGPLTGAVTGTASGNIKQGGGTSQTTNVIYMGWSAAGKLRVQVDTTDFGSTWPIDVSGNAASVTGGVYTSGDQTIGGNKSFSNNILIGTTTRRAIGDGFSPDQTIFNEGAGAGHYKTLVGVANRNDTVGATIILGKSRGTAVGSNTAVSNADTLGEIRFAGADGSSLGNNGAIISAKVMGSPTLNKIPTALIFSTAPDFQSPSSPTERMRITPNGNIGIGKTTPNSMLDVNGTITAFGLTTTLDAEIYGICSVGRYTAESEFNVRGGVRFSQRNGDRQFYSDSLYSQSATNQTYDIPLYNFADWITLGNITNVLEIRITNVREAYTLSTGAIARLYGAYSAAVVIDKYVNTNGYTGYTVNGAASVNITTAFGQGQSSGMPATVGWASIIATRETTTADGTVYLRLRGHTTADTASIQYSSTTACFIQSYAS